MLTFKAVLLNLRVDSVFVPTVQDAAFTKLLTLNLQRVFSLTQKCLPLLRAAAEEGGKEGIAMSMECIALQVVLHWRVASPLCERGRVLSQGSSTHVVAQVSPHLINELSFYTKFSKLTMWDFTSWNSKSPFHTSFTKVVQINSKLQLGTLMSPLDHKCHQMDKYKMFHGYLGY